MTVYTARALDPDIDRELRGELVRIPVDSYLDEYPVDELVLVDGQEADSDTVQEIAPLSAFEFDPENAHRAFKFDPKLHPKDPGGRFLPTGKTKSTKSVHDKPFPTEAQGDAGRAKLHSIFNQMGARSILAGEEGGFASAAKKNSQARIVDKLLGDKEFVEWAEAEWNLYAIPGPTSSRKHVESAVRSVVDSWADSSVHGLGGRIQHLAVQEFGLRSANRKRLDPLEPPVMTKMKPVYSFEHSNAQYRKILRAQYEATQEDFRDRGITHVKLYRGTSSGRIPITGGGKVTLGLKPLSSWSTNAATACDAFAQMGSGNGRIFEAIVPVSRIHSTPRTGIGCLVEYEAVVMGGAPTRARSYSSDEFRDHPAYKRDYEDAYPYPASDEYSDPGRVRHNNQSNLFRFDPENAHYAFKFDPKLHPKGKGGRFLPTGRTKSKTPVADRAFPTEAQGERGRAKLQSVMHKLDSGSGSDGKLKSLSRERILKRLSGDTEFMDWTYGFLYGPGTIPSTLLDHRENTARYAIDKVVESWAGSSTFGLSGQLQHLAAKEFGLRSANRRRLKPMDSSYSEYDNKQLRKMLRAQYDATQEDLASSGITHVKLYRGTSSGRLPKGGVKASTGLKPLSSWSTSPVVATDDFAGMTTLDSARVLVATIPAKRVHSMPTTGLGCLSEREVVVMGGAPTHVRSYSVSEFIKRPEYKHTTGNPHGPSANPFDMVGGQGEPNPGYGDENAFAEFDPHMHPKGPDGRFISTGRAKSSGGGGASGPASEYWQTGKPASMEIGVPQHEFETASTKLFGRVVSAQDIHEMVGAPDGARIFVDRAYQEGDRHIMAVSVRHEHLSDMTRSFYNDPKYGTYVYNGGLQNRPSAPDGFGTQILAHQVAGSRKHGIKGIQTDAEGHGTGDPNVPPDKNGYYTWARLGYTGMMMGGVPKGLPVPYNRVFSVEEVMAMPGGREAWKLHGGPFFGSFDVDPKSHSSRILAGYLQEKGITVNAQNVG